MKVTRRIYPTIMSGRVVRYYVNDTEIVSASRNHVTIDLNLHEGNRAEMMAIIEQAYGDYFLMRARHEPTVFETDEKSELPMTRECGIHGQCTHCGALAGERCPNQKAGVVFSAVPFSMTVDMRPRCSNCYQVIEPGEFHSMEEGRCILYRTAMIVASREVAGFKCDTCGYMHYTTEEAEARRPPRHAYYDGKPHLSIIMCPSGKGTFRTVRHHSKLDLDITLRPWLK